MLSTRPEHVPASRVVDFDCFDLPGPDVQLSWKSLHDGPEIVWTPRNGGHWIATRAADILLMQSDHDRFSNTQFNLPANPRDVDMLPMGVDPPDHRKYRKLVMAALTPRMVDALEVTARRTARELIDAIEPAGSCEFIGDFASVLPVNVFLGMLDLPIADGPQLVAWAAAGSRSSDLEEKKESSRQLGRYIGRYIDERTRTPGDDLISTIARSEIDGRAIARAEVLNVAVNLLFGGLDTVASQMGFIAHYLAGRPDARRDLAERPNILRNAIEELLRRFGLPNTARMVLRDTTYKGVEFRAGDMIQLPRCLVGLDDLEVSRPEEVDFDRLPSSIRHAAFGGGPHSCPGNVLAKRELTVFLEEWLARISDFEIDPDRPPVARSGMLNTFVDLHLRWFPARPAGVMGESA